MRHATLIELAERDGIHLPDALVEDWPPVLSAADEKGWFRFQRLYDVARSVLRTEADVRRLVLEAAEDDVADGGVWLEIQVDPSGYAARSAGSPRSPTWSSTRSPTRPVVPAWGSRSWSPPTAPGTRSTRARWPGWRRSTSTVAWSASGSPTTSGAGAPATSRPPSGSPSAPG